MKHHVKILAGFALAALFAACSPQAPEEPAAAAAAATPAETAEEFVARANAELKELGREIGAAEWVRSTYITVDTAIIAAAASERYAKWHGEMVQQALQYATMLDVPFVFSSNGDGFLEHDCTVTSWTVEQELSLTDFPTPEELWRRYCRWKGLDEPKQSLASRCAPTSVAA